MNGQRFSAIAAAALLLLSGCLPYSCRRQESVALAPADSLSRALAVSVPMDTLALAWTRPIVADEGNAYPRTVRFGPASAGPIYLSDAEQALVFVFDISGAPIDTFPAPNIPWLAGVQADTVALFEPETPAMHFFVAGEPVGTLPIRDEERSDAALTYGAFSNHTVYYKRVDPERGGFVAEIDPSGHAATRHSLPGPYWRHAGMLRFWGDSLLSLSGFRPVVDIIPLDEPPGEPIDTLALRGFDSPMLARSLAWMQGDVHKAPLLTPSAAAEHDLLFVLNLRAGWLRIDAFDRTGRLVHRLTEPERAWDASFFPQDLTVRRQADETWAIAVAVSSPEPELRLYRWTPTTRTEHTP